MSLKKENGDDYEPGTIVTYYGCLKRKLELNSYATDLSSELFKLSRKVLSAKKKNLKKNGKGSLPNRADCLTAENEDQLWQNGQFDFSKPDGLQNFLWFTFTKGFGFRGNHEAKQLCWGDIKLVKDVNQTYLQFTERTTKTRTGDTNHYRQFAPKIFENTQVPNQCPVNAFQIYSVHRPASMKSPQSPFFLGSIKNPTTEVWYKTQAMGINHLTSMLKRMCTAAKITGKFTNHSIRRTTCSRLLDAGIHPNDVAQLTGHKNTQSLNSYATTRINKQRAMSEILLNPQAPPASADTAQLHVPAVNFGLGSVLPSVSSTSSTTINQPQCGYFGGVLNHCNVSFTGNVNFNFK